MAAACAVGPRLGSFSRRRAPVTPLRGGDGASATTSLDEAPPAAGVVPGSRPAVLAPDRSSRSRHPFMCTSASSTVNAAPSPVNRKPHSGHCLRGVELGCGAHGRRVALVASAGGVPSAGWVCVSRAPGGVDCADACDPAGVSGLANRACRRRRGGVCATHRCVNSSGGGSAARWVRNTTSSSALTPCRAARAPVRCAAAASRTPCGAAPGLQAGLAPNLTTRRALRGAKKPSMVRARRHTHAQSNEARRRERAPASVSSNFTFNGAPFRASPPGRG